MFAALGCYNNLDTFAQNGHGLCAKLPKFDHEVRPQLGLDDPGAAAEVIPHWRGLGALCQAFGRMCSEGCLVWDLRLQRRQVALR